MTTSCLYGMVRFAGDLHPAAYSVFPVLAAGALLFAHVAYGCGGVLNKKSDMIRRHYKLANGTDKWKRTNAKLQRQQILLTIKSFRDLKITVGKLYNLERSSFTTFSYIVLNNTITLLLAF